MFISYSSNVPSPDQKFIKECLVAEMRRIAWRIIYVWIFISHWHHTGQLGTTNKPDVVQLLKTSLKKEKKKKSKTCHVNCFCSYCLSLITVKQNHYIYLNIKGTQIYIYDLVKQGLSFSKCWWRGAYCFIPLTSCQPIAEALASSCPFLAPAPMFSVSCFLQPSRAGGLKGFELVSWRNEPLESEIPFKLVLFTKYFFAFVVVKDGVKTKGLLRNARISG